MRQIFASPRLDNVDRVVALLRIGGVEPIVSNRKPWAEGWDRRHMPYSDRQTKAQWPQVWVHPDDLARAREILRDTNVVPTTRAPDLNFVLAQAPAAPARGNKLRLWLLVACALGATLIGLHLFGVL
ncbi:MAG: hypothetical protein ABIP49_00770 [Lysobacterales bacterium]